MADVKTILVAGVGFFMNAYDIFAINFILAPLGLVFWSGSDVQNGFGGNHGVVPDSWDQALKVSTSVGIIIGMMVFGWFAE